MRRKGQSDKNRRPPDVSSDAKYVDAYEDEYARLLKEVGLEGAKAFFRENIAVRCSACGYLGKTVPPLNCARCGAYLD